MAQHRWRWDGTEIREFPFSGLVDEDGVPHPTVAPGDVVVTQNLELGDSDDSWVRLDRPRKSRRSSGDTDVDVSGDEAAVAESETIEPAEVGDTEET